MVPFSACFAVLLPFLELVVEPALLSPDREVVFYLCCVLLCIVLTYMFLLCIVLLHCGFLRGTVLWGLTT